MSTHNSSFLNNCGPSLREQMRTSPIGALRVIRPLQLVGIGLEALGAGLGTVEGDSEDARLTALFRSAVPPIADAAGYTLRIGARSTPEMLAVRLWEALREDGLLVPLAGIVRRHDPRQIEAGTAPIPAQAIHRSRPWDGVDPRGEKSRMEVAIATATALLFPAVAVPPLLLWRREPDPDWSAYTDVWTVRQLTGAVPAVTDDGRSP